MKAQGVLNARAKASSSVLRDSDDRICSLIQEQMYLVNGNLPRGMRPLLRSILQIQTNPLSNFVTEHFVNIMPSEKKKEKKIVKDSADTK